MNVVQKLCWLSFVLIVEWQNPFQLLSCTCYLCKSDPVVPSVDTRKKQGVWAEIRLETREGAEYIHFSTQLPSLDTDHKGNYTTVFTELHTVSGQISFQVRMIITS
jgi:hypothetical protein